MAAKNGCNDAARLLLAHGAFVEAKANVLFLALLNLIFSWFKIKNKKCGSALFSNLSYFNFFVLVHAEWDDTIAPCCLVLNQIRRLLNCQDIT